MKKAKMKVKAKTMGKKAPMKMKKGSGKKC